MLVIKSGAGDSYMSSGWCLMPMQTRNNEWNKLTDEGGFILDPNYSGCRTVTSLSNKNWTQITLSAGLHLMHGFG